MSKNGIRGGAGAVVLCEATRRTFLDAGCSGEQADLAGEIEVGLARLARDGGAGDAARARPQDVGTGYLRFARAESGLFRTAFSASENPRSAASAEMARDGRPTTHFYYPPEAGKWRGLVVDGPARGHPRSASGAGCSTHRRG